MIYSQRNRAKLFILAIACLCMVGSALFIQVQFHEDPCPLCILQRYLFILTALLALTAASLKTRRLMYFLAGLGALSAIIGAILAAKQILIQIKSTFSCGFDLLEPFVDGLPPAHWLPSVFRVSGLCETVYPPIFGLSLPTWSLIGFVSAFTMLVYLVIAQYSSLFLRG
jgi:protein dithiol:quinone oxidoreductase